MDGQAREGWRAGRVDNQNFLHRDNGKLADVTKADGHIIGARMGLA